MLINFTSEQNFKVAIQILEANKNKIIIGGYAITLSFPDSDSMPEINNEIIARFMAKFKAIFPHETKELRFENINQLNIDERMFFLRNVDFRRQLDIVSLMQIIVSSNVLADCALDTKDICERLDNFEPSIESQSFGNSCAARSLLNLMCDENIITPSEKTRSKELQIYRQIWSAPGRMSDPLRIIAYCKSNNISVIGAVHPKQIAKTLANSKNNVQTQATAMFGLFKTAMEFNLDLTREYHQDIFMQKPALLIDQYLHVFFAKRDKQSRIEVMNTNGDVSHYANVDELFQDERFSGVALSLQINTTL